MGFVPLVLSATWLPVTVREAAPLLVVSTLAHSPPPSLPAELSWNGTLVRVTAADPFFAASLVMATEPFREAVLKKMPTSALEDIAIGQGMRTLWQNGLQRAITGQTTLEEIIRVIAADMV